MTTNSDHPWVVVLMDQLWWCRQTTEVIEKCVPPELVLDPKALADYCLNPAQKRLNPMEFHGKRQPQVSGRPQSDDRDNAPNTRSRPERPRTAHGHLQRLEKT